MSSADTDGGVLGVVVIARHGDREGLYQDPFTYTATNTVITPLGEVRHSFLGILEVFMI